MRKASNYIKRSMLYVTLAFAAGCSKSTPFVETDPATGQPPVTLSQAGGDCLIVKISQKNNNGSNGDNAFEIKRDLSLNPQTISLYDSLKAKLEYNIQVTVKGDTLKLSTGEYFVINASTKLVVLFSTLSDISDPLSDKQVYQYVYDANGYLTKKYMYVNGSVAADYETNYSYDNNNLLTGCIMYAGSKKDKLVQSVLTYDMSTARKPWIYLFPDFFEAYHYLQALPFGKRGNYPVKSIITNIYDVNDGSIIDTWTTNYSGYVFSQDDFILQTTASGDLQQGLGLLFGTTRFDYQCSK
jgi:hypothetical protein